MAGPINFSFSVCFSLPEENSAKTFSVLDPLQKSLLNSIWWCSAWSLLWWKPPASSLWRLWEVLASGARRDLLRVCSFTCLYRLRLLRGIKSLHFWEFLSLSETPCWLLPQPDCGSRRDTSSKRPIIFFKEIKITYLILIRWNNSKCSTLHVLMLSCKIVSRGKVDIALEWWEPILSKVTTECK